MRQLGRSRGLQLDIEKGDAALSEKNDCQILLKLDNTATIDKSHRIVVALSEVGVDTSGLGADEPAPQTR